MIKTIPYIFIEIHRIHRKIWVCNWKMRRPDCPCCHLLGCVFHGWPAFQRSRSSNLRNLESSWCAWQCQPQLGSIAESRYYPATQSRFLKMFLKSNEKQLTVLSVPNLNSWSPGGLIFTMGGTAPPTVPSKNPPGHWISHGFCWAADPLNLPSLSSCAASLMFLGTGRISAASTLVM